MTFQPSATAPPAAPTCPTCGATDLTFNASTEPELTYRRCLKCGEVWNAGRHVVPRHRPPSRSGWN